MASELIDKDEPDWLIGNPPSTAFSLWNYAMNYPKMEKEKVDQAIADRQESPKLCGESVQEAVFFAAKNSYMSIPLHEM